MSPEVLYLLQRSGGPSGYCTSLSMQKRLELNVVRDPILILVSSSAIRRLRSTSRGLNLHYHDLRSLFHWSDVTGLGGPTPPCSGELFRRLSAYFSPLTISNRVMNPCPTSCTLYPVFGRLYVIDTSSVPVSMTPSSRYKLMMLLKYLMAISAIVISGLQSYIFSVSDLLSFPVVSC